MVTPEVQRIILIVGLVTTGYLMMMAWQEDYRRQPEAARLESPTVSDVQLSGGFEAPSSENEEVAVPAVQDGMFSNIPLRPPSSSKGQTVLADRLVKVSTPKMIVWIDPLGGDIVGVRLPQFPVSLEEPDVPFVLLDNGAGHTYIAQSGLSGEDALDSDDRRRPLYTVDRVDYHIEGVGQAVTLKYETDGLLVEKTFHFEPDDYLIEMNYRVVNIGIDRFSANLFAQLKWDGSNTTSESGFSMGPRPYVGAALTTQESRYEKVSFEDLDEENLRETVTGGWIAILQHYFLGAWVADANETNQFYGHSKPGDDTYVVGFVGPAFTIEPGLSKTVGAGFYAGPKDQKRLKVIAPNLNLTVDYGFLWWLAVPLFYVLDTLQSIVVNWGLAIILLTILVKIVLFPLSAASYKSMAKMKKLSPQLKRLQERHAGDRQKLSQEMMELYKREKANPLGSCLPLLLQMPVFISLYWVLYESVELRQQPFFGWIHDLAAMDPFFVLPILMGASMYFQQTLNPPMPDPMQARVMKMMPIVFTGLFLFFPAGLVLYWLVNNLLSMAQQWYTTHRIEQAERAS
jgi:YidC/Oxa1 family membrane protein insertase